MKKKMLSLATSLLLIIGTSFAKENNPIPDAVIKDVNQHFGFASQVSWAASTHYYKATVNTEGKYLDVFYNLDGSFIGVSRNIPVDQLPLMLLKDVQAYKAAYYVAELFELVTEKEGTEYYITYKNGMETKVYRGDANGWNLYQSTENK